MVIWQDTPVLICDKVTHIRKIGGRTYRSFIVDNGDIPVSHYNEITRRVDPVINLRGLAYAARKRQAYRKGKTA